MGTLKRGLQGRAGFTLLETSISLAVGGLAVAGAAATLMVLSDQARRLDRRAADTAHRMNAEQVLRLVATNVRITADSVPLAGDNRSVAFPSWCDVPGPALAACRVVLRVERGPRGAAVVLELSSDDVAGSEAPRTLDLWTAPSAELRYLLDAAAGGTWADAWEARTLPLAVGVMSDPDTLILPLGAR